MADKSLWNQRILLGVMISLTWLSAGKADSADVSNATTTTSQPPDDDLAMICYYGSWAVYRPGAGKFDVEDIDPFICTHLVYGFAGLDPSTNTIKSLDPWNDLYDNYGRGAYLRFTGLKKLNPDLKTILAIGGWNEGSSKYSRMAETPNTRGIFISSCVAFLQKYGFDGLDIDWEYPTLRGGQPQDKANFALLLDEMRVEFSKHNLMMTAAVSDGKVTIDAAYDVAALARNLDLIHLMAYDLHGAWESYAHHHSPLYPHVLDKGTNAFLNVDWAVRYWLKIGAPPEKFVLGIGLYGRCFTLASAAKHTVYSPAPQPGQPGPYTREPGVLGYNEICEQQLQEIYLNEIEYENAEGGVQSLNESTDQQTNENGTTKQHEEQDASSTKIPEEYEGGPGWETVNGSDTSEYQRSKRSVYIVEVPGEERDDKMAQAESSREDKGRLTTEATEDNSIRGLHEKGRYTDDDTDEKEPEYYLIMKDFGRNRKSYKLCNESSGDLREEDTVDGGWTVVRDKHMISPYAFKDRQWCGYDDVISAVVKAKYIKSLGLAGAMVWSIETDDFHGICNKTLHFPLITTIRTILRDGKPIPTPTPGPNTTTTFTTVTTPSTTTTPGPTPPPTDICHREGYNADPKGDCTVFYYCHQVEGKWMVYRFRCAPGTVFVEDLQQCDFPEGHPECNILPGPGGSQLPVEETTVLN